MFPPDVIAQLRQADKIPYAPKPRDFIKKPPTHALLVITDGITPEAMRRASTPTFDALAARGVCATDARTIFPTITGPAHTSILTGARVGTHGFLYPKMLDAFGNRLLDFNEGLMRAETVAEAWRPQGIVSVGVGSRFLRGADMSVSEGIVGEDFLDITDRAIQAVRDWQPYFLMVVYYVADTMGHLFGPEADETLKAIEAMDAMTARILDAYAEQKLLDSTTVAVLADHGMARVDEVVDIGWAERVGALPHGRLAFAPHALSGEQIDALLNDPRVEDIFGREELELLGAWGPQWGEHVIHLKEGLMFPHERKLVGYHGAWSRTEQHIPLLVSGAGIRAGATLETCESIDLAPTLSVLLGGNIPEQNQGRVLWEVLDIETRRDSDYASFILERELLLDEFKMLKREFAGGALYHDEFESRKSALLQRADENRAAMENALREENSL